MTKKIKVVIVLSFMTVLGFGQATYKSKTIVNSTSTFVTEFIINKDSTCFYNRRYLNNSQFMLYKGHIKKINDTLYTFNYKPIVEFGCNMRLYYQMDSVHFQISQIDTVLPSLLFSVKTADGFVLKINPDQRRFFYLKGAGKLNFSLDTKFINPLTGKRIYMSVSPPSEPQLIFYGSNTQNYSAKISINEANLIIHRGVKGIQEEDVLKLSE